MERKWEKVKTKKEGLAEEKKKTRRKGGGRMRRISEERVKGGQALE